MQAYYQSGYHGTGYHASQYYRPIGVADEKEKTTHERFDLRAREREDEELLVIIAAFVESYLDS